MSPYCTIDIADHLLKNAAIFYRTWKYWHAPKTHSISIAIVIAYSLYEECCDGELDGEWKIDKREKKFLAIQGDSIPPDA